MGCSPTKIDNKAAYISSLKMTSSKIQTLNEFKITEGMLVQESKEDIFKVYEQIKILGEGTYGKVFLAKHKISNVLRAIKQIQKDKANLGEEDEKAIINEINIIKSLDHPNIMKVYEYFNTDKYLSIVSELCTGGELFEKISKQKNLSEKVSKFIFKQLLSAVDFCHENNIIHRDLKPENILLESEEEAKFEYFTIKVIDFGTSDKLGKNKTVKGQIGTPFYIAPEVLGNNKYNEKCDLWSCGVILYIMLCGVPPFYGETDEEIYEVVKKGKLEFEEPIWKTISEPAKDLIRKLLNKNIKERLSAKEALEHQWVKSLEYVSNVPKEELNSIIMNLHNFSATQKLQQATLAFIVHNLIKTEEVKNLRKVFIEFDQNGDGRLNKDELIDGLSSVLEREKAEKEANRLMQIIDVDGNGFIEYEEFLRAGLDKKKILTTENVRNVFRLFDQDGSGKISPEELKQVMGQGSNDIDDKIWLKLVEEIDLNKDGEISFYEFDKMMDLVRDDYNLGKSNLSNN